MGGEGEPDDDPISSESPATATVGWSTTTRPHGSAAEPTGPRLLGFAVMTGRQSSWRIALGQENPERHADCRSYAGVE